MKIEPKKVTFNYLLSEQEIEVVYTFTGEYFADGMFRPVYQVAVFNHTKQKGKPMGTYWGCINKTNAITYAKKYLKP